MSEKIFKIFAEIECTGETEFEVYQQFYRVLFNKGFIFRRGSIVEKEKQFCYMHGNGM